MTEAAPDRTPEQKTPELKTPEQKTLGVIVWRWWIDLHPDAHGRGDRGPRARLRRCATPAEALVEPQTIRLIEALREEETGRLDERIGRSLEAAHFRREPRDGILSAIACLAACLAEAEPPQDKSDRRADFAARLGQTRESQRPSESEQPRLSRLRFARLMQAEGWPDRQRELRRALKMLGEARFNVERFATDLVWWGDASRRSWLLAYHQQFRSADPAARREETQP